MINVIGLIGFILQYNSCGAYIATVSQTSKTNINIFFWYTYCEADINLGKNIQQPTSFSTADLSGDRTRSYFELNTLVRDVKGFGPH